MVIYTIKGDGIMLWEVDKTKLEMMRSVHLLETERRKYKEGSRMKKKDWFESLTEAKEELIARLQKEIQYNKNRILVLENKIKSL